MTCMCMLIDRSFSCRKYLKPDSTVSDVKIKVVFYKTQPIFIKIQL